MNDEEETDGLVCSQMELPPSVFDCLLNDRFSSNKEVINSSSANKKFQTSFNKSTTKTRTKNGNTWKNNPSFFRHKKPNTKRINHNLEAFGENSSNNNNGAFSTFGRKNDQAENAAKNEKPNFLEFDEFGFHALHANQDVVPPNNDFFHQQGCNANDNNSDSADCGLDDLSLKDSLDDYNYNVLESECNFAKGTPDNATLISLQSKSSSFFNESCLEDQKNEQTLEEKEEFQEFQPDSKRRKLTSEKFVKSGSNYASLDQERERVQEERERKRKISPKKIFDRNFEKNDFCGICFNLDENFGEFDENEVLTPQRRESEIDDWLESVVKCAPKWAKNQPKSPKKTEH